MIHTNKKHELCWQTRWPDLANYQVSLGEIRSLSTSPSEDIYNSNIKLFHKFETSNIILDSQLEVPSMLGVGFQNVAEVKRSVTYTFRLQAGLLVLQGKPVCEQKYHRKVFSDCDVVLDLLRPCCQDIHSFYWQPEHRFGPWLATRHAFYLVSEQLLTF